MHKKKLYPAMTSVLIIIMMIVLLSLAGFSISSANLNYKLSRKVLDWNFDFYELESDVEKFLMKTDFEIFDFKNKIKREYNVELDTNSKQFYINKFYELYSNNYENLYLLQEDQLHLEKQFFSKKDTRVNIKLKLNILPTINSSESLAKNKNFEILEYSKWQNINEYKNTIDLWTYP